MACVSAGTPPRGSGGVGADSWQSGGSQGCRPHGVATGKYLLFAGPLGAPSVRWGWAPGSQTQDLLRLKNFLDRSRAWQHSYFCQGPAFCSALRSRSRKGVASLGRGRPFDGTQATVPFPSSTQKPLRGSCSQAPGRRPALSPSALESLKRRQDPDGHPGKGPLGLVGGRDSVQAGPEGAGGRRRRGISPGPEGNRSSFWQKEPLASS